MVSAPLGAAELTGTIDSECVQIPSRRRADAGVVQLRVDQELGDYQGYSGSGVLAGGDRVTAVLIEQALRRTRRVSLADEASNVLYAVSVGAVVAALGLNVSIEDFGGTRRTCQRPPAGSPHGVSGSTMTSSAADPWVGDSRFFAVYLRNDGTAPATEVEVTCFSATTGVGQPIEWGAPALPGGKRTHYVLHEDLRSFPPDGDAPDVAIEFVYGGQRWRRFNNGPVEPIADS